MSKLSTPSIGIIGVGKMGGLIGKGIVTHFPDYSLHLFHKHPENIDNMLHAKQVSVYGLDDFATFYQASDYIFLCIKPHQIEDFISQHRQIIEDNGSKVWISVAVGKSLEQLERLTPTTHQWIRLMPNTPMQVGQGYIALCAHDYVEDLHIKRVKEWFGKLGRVAQFDENYFDIISAIAGSGPAYLFLIADALADAGLKHGLKKEALHPMIGQLMVGAGQMLLDSAMHPSLLKDQVTSPGGTTIEGIASLEANGLRHAMIEAIDQVMVKTQQLK